MVKFEWHQAKARANFKKHKVSFEEAATVFSNEPIRIFMDTDSSTDNEDRLIAIGYSQIQRLLVVVHCYRENDEVIRIVSARKATRIERQFFEEGYRMKKEYDFSKMKEVRPSYLKKLKQQVTIKLDKDVVEYFKTLATQMDLPYQTLINLYLKECAKSQKKLSLKWDQIA